MITLSTSTKNTIAIVFSVLVFVASVLLYKFIPILHTLLGMAIMLLGFCKVKDLISENIGYLFHVKPESLNKYSTIIAIASILLILIPFVGTAYALVLFWGAYVKVKELIFKHVLN